MIFTPEQIKMIHDNLAEFFNDFSKDEVIEMLLDGMPTEQLFYMLQEISGLGDLPSDQALKVLEEESS